MRLVWWDLIRLQLLMHPEPFLRDTTVASPNWGTFSRRHWQECPGPYAGLMAHVGSCSHRGTVSVLGAGSCLFSQLVMFLLAVSRGDFFIFFLPVWYIWVLFVYSENSEENNRYIKICIIHIQSLPYYQVFICTRGSRCECKYTSVCTHVLPRQCCRHTHKFSLFEIPFSKFYTHHLLVYIFFLLMLQFFKKQSLEPD